MSDDTRDALRRLQAVYMPGQTHASDPVACRRKVTDSPVAGGQDYGTRKNTMANRRHGGTSTRRRPSVQELIGAALVTPPTTRVSAPRVTRTQNGTRTDAVSNATRNAGIATRIANGTPAMPDQQLRVNAESEQWRAWAAARRSHVESLGEIATRGTVYPNGLNERTVQGRKRVTLSVPPAGNDTTIRF